MVPTRGAFSRILERASRVDARWLAVRAGVRRVIIGATLLSVVAFSLPHVPRPFADYRRIPILNQIEQSATYGTDTIADAYEARVVLNDVFDMYTKREVEQTPIEAATWSKAASAPYPPAVLLTQAALMAVGDRLRVGLYGMTLAVAVAVIVISLWYCLKTRWYVFPLLYLNFSYFGERFAGVQDGSYLVMLLVVMVALVLARSGRPAAHVLMAVAITMKLSPLFYVTHLRKMPVRTAVIVVGVLLAGFALPILIWENYLYIFRFNDELKMHPWSTIGALAVAGPFALTLSYVDARLGFDWEDRVGWCLVPVGLFFAFKMNVARHLMVVLLVPDKRGWRSVAAAVALAVPALSPGLVRFNSAAAIATVLLVLVLAGYLNRIGWSTVGNDLRHPGSTLRRMITGWETEEAR